MNEILTYVWELANSPVGIAMIASMLIYVLNKLYASKPAWAAYEGTIIAGIKSAEKLIPDDATNKGVARLNCALQSVIQVIEEREKRLLSAREEFEIKEAIQVVHAELEAAGNLHNPYKGLSSGVAFTNEVGQ